MSGATGRDPVRSGPAHVVHPAEAFEEADDGGRRVELAAVDAVARAGEVGVVEVVPALAEREQGEGPQVGGPVLAPGAERALTDRGRGSSRSR
ncbi:hypothetical protein GCM10011428_34610 [Streptomyces violaceus]